MVQNKHQDLAKFGVKFDQNSELELSFFDKFKSFFDFESVVNLTKIQLNF
jgi:hypothetical protein